MKVWCQRSFEIRSSVCEIKNEPQILYAWKEKVYIVLRVSLGTPAF